MARPYSPLDERPAGHGFRTIQIYTKDVAGAPAASCVLRVPVYGDAVNSFFIIFVHHQDAPGPPRLYRGADRKLVVYNTQSEAAAAAAEATATNKSPNVSFTVTEFQPV